MSWQNFVHESMVVPGHIAEGAIISLADNGIWGSTSGLQFAEDELDVISAIIRGDEDIKSKVFEEGLWFSGTRYVVPRMDEIIYGRAGQKGIVIAGAITAIVIGLHNETQFAGNATNVVVSVAEHLKAQAKLAEEAAKEQAEEPAEDSAEDPAKDPAEDSAEDPAEDPAEDSAEDPAES